MANDATLPLRRAMLTALKGNDALTTLVPAEEIHPQSPAKPPSWPFVKLGSPSAVPIRAACVDGAEFIVAVHAFAKPRYNGGGGMLETAEDHCARIGAFVASALDRSNLSLGVSGKARVRWTGSQLLQDLEEADAFHSVVNFRVRVIA